MAVVIQPYNPWREQLAANILMPIVSDLWKTHRENELNRKRNTLRGRAIKEIAAMGGASNQSGGMTGGLGTSGALGTNSGNPMAEFDANTGSTAGVADLAAQAARGLGIQETGAGSQPYMPTATDWRNTIGRLAADKRFSHLSPQGIDELFAPNIQAAEAARLEARRNEAAQNYINAMNAGNLFGARNGVMGGVIGGYIPESTGNMVNAQFGQDRPQTSMLNTGGENRAIRVNPVTGDVEEVARFENTLTPAQVQAGEQWDKQFEWTKATDQRNFEANREDARNNYNLQKQPKLTNVTRLDDGRRIGTFSDGTEKELTPDTAGFNSVEKIRLTQLETRRKELIAHQTDLKKALAKAQTDEERTSLINSINGINTQIQNIDNEINSMYTNKLTPPSQKANPTTELWTPSNNDDPSMHDIGAHMTSNAHGGPNGISTPYKTVRKRDDGSTYIHYGVDYKTPNGTEILVPDVGVPLTVTRGGNQPDGYGHYVRLAGNLNGHRIELTIAHMQEGVNVKQGDKVKAGDLIGLSGNSGNSRGDNGGYHMHLETKLDGEYVDPTQFRKLIQPYMARSNASGNNELFLMPNVDGKNRVITEKDFDELVRKAEAGQLPNAPNVRTRDDVIKWLLDNGCRPMREIATTQDNSNVAGNGNAGQENQPYSQGDNQPIDAISGAAPKAQPTQGQTNLANVLNNPTLNWTPSYQSVNMPDAYNATNVPIWQPTTQTRTEPQLAQPTPQPATANQPVARNGNGGIWDSMTGLFSATPAAAEELPVTQLTTPAISYDNSANPYNLPPVGQARHDPDGGLSNTRADGDNSPVTWRNASGNPMRTSNGQLFTQNEYEDLARRADAGEFSGRGINNRADLDKWLYNQGLRPSRPSEERGVNNLNGNSNANLPPESEDTNLMPPSATPQTHPELYPAPQFTDEINGTTPEATEDILNGLNGITDEGYRRWTEALRRYYPSAIRSPQINNDNWIMPQQAPERSIAAPAQTPPVQPTQKAPAPRRAAPRPKAGRTNYDQQRTAVDGAAKRHGVDSALIRAIIQVESGWNPNARSKVGAMGLMQLMPKTAKWLGVKNAYDPAQNIAGGSKYIAQLIRQFDGDVSKALMAYNCGPGAVKKGRIPAASKQYAKKVMSIYKSLR